MLIGPCRGEQAQVAGQFLDRRIDGRWGQGGIETFQRRAQPGSEHDLRAGAAPQHAAATGHLFVSIDRFPAEFLKKLDGGLFNQGVFAVIT